MNMNAKKRINGSWVDAPDCIHKYGTDTDTFTTLPANIIADGTPLLDYLISGNMSQSGTPSPDSPIQPQECGERTGNILDFNELITAPSGLIPGVGTFTFDHLLVIEAEPNTTYVMSATGTGSMTGDSNVNRSLYFCGVEGTFAVFSGHDVTYTTSSDGKLYVGFISSRDNAQQYLNGTAVTAINEGSTALPYETYGYKLPITSAGQTNNIYLGEVPTTRKIKKLVLTGVEPFTLQSINSHGIANFYIRGVLITKIRKLITTHFKIQSTLIADTTDEGYMYDTSNTTLFFRINSTTASTVNELNTWLTEQNANGTPVTVWYVLAEPEIGIVNEPLRKIGNYADTLSYEQAGVQIPTNRGNTVIDVETMLKPSEVSLSYKGWHPLVGHKRINGAWT